jgi:N6-adenosine-specific RNA methylase IME4
VKQYNIWVPKALEFAMKITPTKKFRVLLMDPPYNNTGCILGYQTMDDKEWFDVLNFDELIDDGLIFIWVTNAKLGVIISLMQIRGWAYWENFCWNKYDQQGNTLKRGGYGAFLSHELCLVFKRSKPINGLDKFHVPRAVENTINTI